MATAYAPVCLGCDRALALATPLESQTFAAKLFRSQFVYDVSSISSICPHCPGAFKYTSFNKTLLEFLNSTCKGLFIFCVRSLKKKKKISIAVSVKALYEVMDRSCCSQSECAEVLASFPTGGPEDSLLGGPRPGREGQISRRPDQGQVGPLRRAADRQPALSEQDGQGEPPSKVERSLRGECRLPASS